MPERYCQCRDELSRVELQQLELRTCLTVAEKALLWQAPRIGLEASRVLEASIMYTGNVELRLSKEIKQLLDVRCGQMDGKGSFEKSEARKFWTFSR